MVETTNSTSVSPGKIHNIVLMMIRGLNFYEIFVPAKKNNNNYQLVLHKSLGLRDREMFGFFCTPENTDLLKETLGETSIIDFSKYILACHASYDLKEAVKEVLTARTGRALHEESPKCLYTVKKDVVLKWGESSSASALGSVRPLNEAAVTQCYELWAYRPLRHTPLQVFFDIAKVAPTAGFYLHEDPKNPGNADKVLPPKEVVEGDDCMLPYGPSKGLPVAMISTTHDGALGMHFTKKEYRNLGLGSITGMACTKQMVLNGYEPCLFVEKCNTVWQDHLLRTGFELLHEVTWISAPPSP